MIEKKEKTIKTTYCSLYIEIYRARNLFPTENFLWHNSFITVTITQFHIRNEGNWQEPQAMFE